MDGPALAQMLLEGNTGQRPVVAIYDTQTAVQRAINEVGMPRNLTSAQPMALPAAAYPPIFQMAAAAPEARSLTDIASMFDTAAQRRRDRRHASYVDYVRNSFGCDSSAYAWMMQSRAAEEASQQQQMAQQRAAYPYGPFSYRSSPYDMYQMLQLVVEPTTPKPLKKPVDIKETFGVDPEGRW
jgi:hypothetical protein